MDREKERAERWKKKFLLSLGESYDEKTGLKTQDLGQGRKKLSTEKM